MKKLRVLLLMLALCLLTGCAAPEKDEAESGSGKESAAKKKLDQKQELMADDDDDSGKGSSTPLTAEELLNGLADVYKNKPEYVDLDMRVVLEALYEVGEVLGTDETTMTMKMSIAINMTADEDTQHLVGITHLEMMGFVEDEQMNLYRQKDGNFWQTYFYDTDRNKWLTSLEAVEDGERSFSESMSDFQKDLFEDLELENPYNEDYYIVTGIVPYDKVAEYMMMMDEYSDLGTDDSILQGRNFDLTMTFDKKTREVRSMLYTLKDIEVDGTQIQQMSIELKVNEYGFEKEVAVPANVMDEAEPEEKLGTEDSDLGDL